MVLSTAAENGYCTGFRTRISARNRGEYCKIESHQGTRWSTKAAAEEGCLLAPRRWAKMLLARTSQGEYCKIGSHQGSRRFQALPLRTDAAQSIAPQHRNRLQGEYCKIESHQRSRWSPSAAAEEGCSQGARNDAASRHWLYPRELKVSTLT